MDKKKINCVKLSLFKTELNKESADKLKIEELKKLAEKYPPDPSWWKEDWDEPGK